MSSGYLQEWSGLYAQRPFSEPLSQAHASTDFRGFGWQSSPPVFPSATGFKLEEDTSSVVYYSSKGQSELLLWTGRQSHLIDLHLYGEEMLRMAKALDVDHGQQTMA